MNDPSNVVAVYNSHTEAEQAVAKLSAASFDITKISIIGKDYHTEEKVVGYYSTGDRMKSWGGLGAFWGGIWGLLFGAGFFLVPGIGPVLVAGPFLAALIGALESAVVVGGLSAVAAGLVSFCLSGCFSRPQLLVLGGGAAAVSKNPARGVSHRTPAHRTPQRGKIGRALGGPRYWKYAAMAHLEPTTE